MPRMKRQATIWLKLVTRQVSADTEPHAILNVSRARQTQSQIVVTNCKEAKIPAGFSDIIEDQIRWNLHDNVADEQDTETY